MNPDTRIATRWIAVLAPPVMLASGVASWMLRPEPAAWPLLGHEGVSPPAAAAPLVAVTPRSTAPTATTARPVRAAEPLPAPTPAPVRVSIVEVRLPTVVTVTAKPAPAPTTPPAAASATPTPEPTPDPPAAPVPLPIEGAQP